MENRVVVTGIGVLAPNGIGIDSFWNSLVKGKSGISRITRFDPSELKSQIAGEVKNFDPNQYIDHSLRPTRLARHAQFAVVGASMALEDAALSFSETTPPEKALPVIIGLSTSSFDIIAEGGQTVLQKGPHYVSPNVVTQSSPNSVIGALSKFLKIPTQSLSVSSACVAGLDAVIEAARRIKTGEAEVVLAGGTDAPIDLTPMASFDNAGMASRQNDHPEKASCPFDKKRDSGVISEGCGMLVLESLDHAKARGATPYLEILGYGNYVDSDSQVPGSGLKLSMKRALENSSTLPKEIDYICAWAPSHPVLDKVETDMIKRVFEEHAYSIPISSIKGVTGNPLAAAGPLMLISCCLMYKNKIIPPTANYETPDPNCDLDYVPNRARHSDVQLSIINGHGIGGTNISMVVSNF